MLSYTVTWSRWVSSLSVITLPTSTEHGSETIPPPPLTDHMILSKLFHFRSLRFIICIMRILRVPTFTDTISRIKSAMHLTAWHILKSVVVTIITAIIYFLVRRNRLKSCLCLLQPWVNCHTLQSFSFLISNRDDITVTILVIVGVLERNEMMCAELTPGTSHCYYYYCY